MSAKNTQGSESQASMRMFVSKFCRRIYAR